MFHYKSLIGFCLIGILGLGISCSDDFLNQEPQGIPSSVTLFADENGAVLATNAVYAYLRNWNVVGFPYFGVQELPSDDADVGSTPSDGSFGRLESINTFTYDPSVGELNGYWTGMYQGIARANQVIYYVPDIDMDETLKARLIGEAKLLRAFFYFRLVRAFGEVPLIDKVYDDPVDASIAVPKTTPDSIYSLIIADLEAAEKVLPLKSAYPASELGRATLGTADALLAKVYLFRQNYEQAKAYALKVIQSGEYSLYPEYRGVFLPDQENGVESIFEAQIINTDGQQIENQYTKWQGARGAFGWGFLSPSENLYNAYEPGDPRREATILVNGDTLEDYGVIKPSAEGAPPRANRKTMLPGNLQPAGYPAQSPTNYIILRYADVLLMYAEAANETGDPAQAAMYLNMVRARARGGNPNVLPDITTTDPAQLREAIWKERRIELALEGQRFFDIIRENNVVPGRAKDIFTAAGKPDFNINRHATFPVPLTQIDISNGILKQDANW